MFTPVITSRRALLIGGASAALVGCAQESGSSSDQGSSPSDGPPIPYWAEIGTILSVTAFAGPLAGRFVAGIGLRGVASFLARLGVGADRASSIHDGIDFAYQAARLAFGVPAASAAPRPILVPQSNNINSFNYVPVFDSNVGVEFGLLGGAEDSFAGHAIFTTVKRADDPVPRTYEEALAGEVAKYALINPAPNGKDRVHDVGPLPIGGYISYSWQLPRGTEPTDEIIASSPMISPAFLSVAGSEYQVDFSDLVELGDAVQTQYRIPEEGRA